MVYTESHLRVAHKDGLGIRIRPRNMKTKMYSQIIKYNFLGYFSINILGSGIMRETF